MNTFKEHYTVKLNYQKPDGYWVIGHIVEISIDVAHGTKEKNNHKKAEEEALKQFPNAKITRVDYH